MSGLPAPDVSWYLNGSPVQSDELHKMIVSEKGFHSLIFEVVRASDAGSYACVARNRAGEATFTVQLDVLGKPPKRSFVDSLTENERVFYKRKYFKDKSSELQT